MVLPLVFALCAASPGLNASDSFTGDLGVHLLTQAGIPSDVSQQYVSKLLEWTTEQTIQYVQDRPETLTLLSHCINRPTNNSKCDVLSALTTITKAVLLRSADKKIPIPTIDHNGMGMGTRPLAGVGQSSIMSTAIDPVKLQFGEALVSILLGFAYLSPNPSKQDYTSFDQISKLLTVSSNRPLSWTLEKWRLIKTAFPNFHRWREVYSQNGALHGGPSVICKDWLIHFFSGLNDIGTEMDSLEWQDREKIFEPNLASRPVAVMSQLAQHASLEWKKMTQYNTQEGWDVKETAKESSGNASAGSGDGGQAMVVPPKVSAESKKNVPVKHVETDKAVTPQFVKWLSTATKSSGPVDSVPADFFQNDEAFFDQKLKEFHHMVSNRLGVVSHREGPDLRSLCKLFKSDNDISTKESKDLDRVLSEFNIHFTAEERQNGIKGLCDVLHLPDEAEAQPDAESQIETFFGLPAAQLEAMLLQYLTDGHVDRRSFGKFTYINELDANNWTRWWSFKLYLKRLAEQQRQYWMSPGPLYRVSSLFSKGPDNLVDSKEWKLNEISDMAGEGSNRVILLPEEDLKMCWAAMETALFTRDRDDLDSFHERFRSKYEHASTIVGVIASIAMAMVTVIRYFGASPQEARDWEQSCSALVVPDWLQLTCTDGFNAGSQCWSACLNGKVPVDRFGHAVPRITRCIGGNVWAPNILNTNRCDDPIIDAFLGPGQEAQ